MENEQKIVDRVLERFPFLEGHINVQRKRRIITDALSKSDFEQVFAFLTEEVGFTTFHLVIGLDDGEELGFLYVVSDENRIAFMLKQKAPKVNPVIKSVCAIFPNALWHERELVDLFGAVVEELPPGPSYPLPDNWPEGNYPLRKEWKVEYFDKDTMTYNPPEPKKENIAATEDGGTQ